MKGGRKLAAAAALLGAAGLAFLLLERMPESKPAPVLSGPLREPRVLIRRGARVLELYDGGRLVRRYRAAMGSRGEGGRLPSRW